MVKFRERIMIIPDTKNLYSEIIQALKENANKGIAETDKFYHKKEGYKSYGLKIPTVKKIIKQFKLAFEGLTFTKRINLAQKLYKSGFAEEGRVANSILALSVHELAPKDFKKIDKWNKSKNMWKRRASVVAFVRKNGESGKFTDDALKLCDNLIWDEEDLIHKAVGWALKDVMRGDKKKVLNYVRDLRRKGVSSTIILYAIRDLKDKEREKILQIKPIQTK